MCVYEPSKCSCPGHTYPGVAHVAPCCDEPHVEDVEWVAKLNDPIDVGFKGPFFEIVKSEPLA